MAKVIACSKKEATRLSRFFLLYYLCIFETIVIVLLGHDEQHNDVQNQSGERCAEEA